MSTIGQAVSLVSGAPFDPFNSQPVKGVNWNYNANFGTPLNAFAYTGALLRRR